MDHPLIAALKQQTPRYLITNSETGHSVVMADLANLRLKEINRIVKDTLDGKTPAP